MQAYIDRMNKYLLVFIVSLILGLIYDYFFYGKIIGLNLFLYIAILFFAYILFVEFILKKSFNYWVLLSITGLILSFDLVLYNNI